MPEGDAATAAPRRKRWVWLFAAFCLCWAYSMMLATVDWDVAEQPGHHPAILLLDQFQQSGVGMCLGVGALLASILLLALLMLRGWAPAIGAVIVSLIIGLACGAGSSALYSYPGSALEPPPPSDWLFVSVRATLGLLLLALPTMAALRWRERGVRKRPARPSATA